MHDRGFGLIGPRQVHAVYTMHTCRTIYASTTWRVTSGVPTLYRRYMYAMCISEMKNLCLYWVMGQCNSEALFRNLFHDLYACSSQSSDRDTGCWGFWIYKIRRNNSCTNANYIWERSCGYGKAKNATPRCVQSTHKAVRACKLFLLHHRSIIAAMEIRANSLQTLRRNNSFTNANYIWERSCGNGEAKNAHTTFVQSTHKAVRACKLFLLHHRRIITAMEISANSLQTLRRTNSCTNANYIWERSCGYGEAKSANTTFVQSTHKAVRACKLLLLHHRRIMPAMEIREILCKTYDGTIVALMQTTYEKEAVGMGWPKTQTLRLCNQRTKRYELANCSSFNIDV